MRPYSSMVHPRGWRAFMAQGARAGDTVLAANAVLHNFTLIGSFFLDGFAVAAEQLPPNRNCLYLPLPG